MPRYAFSLGIVPVQEWLGEATRSRDLRAGSAILSWLMARVLARLRDGQEGLSAQIEIPAESLSESFAQLGGGTVAAALEAEYGVPNRAFGFFDAEGERARAVLAGLQTLVDESWQRIEAEKLAELLNGKSLSPELWQELAPSYAEYVRRTAGGADCPFSVVWVATPSPAEEAFEDSLLRLDHAFADVKRTRPVRPLLWGERVGKCNQCGRREAIGPTTSYGAWRAWHGRLRGYLQALPPSEQGRRLDPGERLCFVCLRRRLAAYAGGGDFPSTGDVAIAPWQAAVVKQPELAALLRGVRETPLGAQDLGRALLASPQALRNLLEPGEAAKLLAARGALEQAIRRRNLRLPAEASPLAPAPPGYLALLTFDGDDMGRHVRESESARRHMNAFAEQARLRLTRHTDAVFYLAGDEGLALLPAAEALATAIELRQDFAGIFDAGITLSAGLVYFDYHRPLQGAIAAGREALERGKGLRSKHDEKNALGVAVETASGTRFHCTDHWGAAWDRAQALLAAIGSGKLSRGWPHDAEAFLRSLRPEQLRRSEVAEAARDELRRLLLRRASGKPTAKTELWNRVDRGGEEPEARWLPGAGNASDADLLHLVSFLARVALPVLAVEQEGQEAA